MLQLRFLISCCALLLALAPMVGSADHAQDEIAKADATLANALAIGRTDEIANARAQSADLHGLADLIAGAQAQANMSNDLLIGQDRADAIHTPGVAAAENGAAMAANELLAADTV